MKVVFLIEYKSDCSGTLIVDDQEARSSKDNII